MSSTAEVEANEVVGWRRRPAPRLPARSGVIDAFAAENHRRFTGAVDISTDQEATDGTACLAIDTKEDLR